VFYDIELNRAVGKRDREDEKSLPDCRTSGKPVFEEYQGFRVIFRKGYLYRRISAKSRLWNREAGKGSDLCQREGKNYE